MNFKNFGNFSFHFKIECVAIETVDITSVMSDNQLYYLHM
jgi:hypothetical protein